MSSGSRRGSKPAQNVSTESIADFFGTGVSADRGIATSPEMISKVRARQFILSNLVKFRRARRITTNRDLLA
jgi:hypothetical protein